MAEKEPTWWLLGLATSSNSRELGFKMGWQYDEEYTAIVENINETHEPNAGGELEGGTGDDNTNTDVTSYPMLLNSRVGGGDGGHGGGGAGGDGGHGGGNAELSLAWGIHLDRDGNVSITDAIKEACQGLVKVGVLFVLEWKNPKKALGGKFDWIGEGDAEGSHHNVSKQNIVSKMEKPVGKTKPNAYWYQRGCPKGPYIVSELLKKKSDIGGVIVTVGGLWKAMDWAHIPNGEK